MTAENLEITKGHIEITKDNLDITKLNLEVTKDTYSKVLDITKTIDAKVLGILYNMVTMISCVLTDLIFLDDKAYELLKMLSPLEPRKRHDDIRSTRVEQTGTWLLQLRSFCNWSNNTGTRDLVQQIDPVFCCYGMPGAGKTVLRYRCPPYKNKLPT